MDHSPFGSVTVPAESTSSSRRVSKRNREARQRMEMVARAVAALNEAFAPRSTRSADAAEAFHAIDSLRSTNIVAAIKGPVGRFLRRRGASASGSAAKPGVQSGQFRTRDSAVPLSSVRPAYAVDNPVALEIIADRVSLPKTAAGADLLSLLPEDIREQYAQPGSIELPAEERSSESPPQATVRATHTEYVKLLRRMLAVGMLDFTRDPKAINGLFAVDKGEGKQRLILDARPANAMLRPSPAVELPTPDVIAALEAPPRSTLYVAKLDVQDCYHNIVVPQWLRAYFALPAVRAGELGLSGYAADELVFPCCKTLPMGFSHSVFLAQTVHVRLLLRSVPAGDLIARGNDNRVDRLRAHSYIDDAFFVDTDPERCAAVQRSHERELREAKLPVHPGKRVLPSCDGVEIVGVELHGKDRVFGLSAPKLQLLCNDTERLLAKGRVGLQELESCIGSWAWAALPRRPAFALMNAVYTFQEAARRGFGPMRLWPSVCAELRSLVALAPLLFADLGARWHSTVFASDASSWGLGVVNARVGRETIARAAAGSGVRSLPAQDSVVAMRQEGLGMLRGARWRTRYSKRWSDNFEHINALELRAVVMALRMTIRGHNSGMRVLGLVDSTVVVAAVSKGRSSSFVLLRQLRRLTALCLAYDVRLYLRWVCTESNPADAPSRSFVAWGHRV